MKCKYCENEYLSYRHLNGHLASCKMGPNRKKFLENHRRNSKRRRNVEINNLTLPSSCRFCNKIFSSMYGRNGHEIRCPNNPKKPIPNLIRKNHTQETRDKISFIRKEYIRNNPDKVPYRMYHKSKGRSYAQQYFLNVLSNLGLTFEEEFPLGPYNLDFAFVKEKIDLEIDGNQHFVRGVRVASDFIRDKNLKNLGWITVRVVWSDFCKLSKISRLEYISNIIDKFELTKR